MKSWTVKRDDGRCLLHKNGTPKLFKTRTDAAAAAKKAKGAAKVQRVEIADI